VFKRPPSMSDSMPSVALGASKRSSTAAGRPIEDDGNSAKLGARPGCTRPLPGSRVPTSERTANGTASHSLRSLCGPHPREHPRTATAAPSIFAAFRPYSRQFADLRNIGAPISTWLRYWLFGGACSRFAASMYTQCTSESSRCTCDVHPSARDPVTACERRGGLEPGPGALSPAQQALSQPNGLVTGPDWHV
jgi:hypothetical protein